jgi:acetyltransferase-like isoleucine patch superfamily enzyme
MKSLSNILEYCTILINIIKYKPFLKESKFFYVKANPKIIGCKMISIGDSFFANRFLRIEVFGDNNKIKLTIGNNVSVGQNVHIGVNNQVRIMDNVLIGSNVLITDHNHGCYAGEDQSSPLEAPVLRKLTSNGYVLINNNVWIGDGVVILPNVEIGSGTIIGANSVVTKDLPENVIAGGIPCRIIKKYNDALAIWENI